MSEPIVIPRWAQGRPDRGQGGYAAARFALALGQPVSVDLRAPIPLETPLEVCAAEGGWELRDGPTTIMRAQPRTDGGFPRTTPVTPGDATVAMAGFPGRGEAHEAPACFSCGLGDGSMGVWPGPLADGTPRLATGWIPPSWAGGDDGRVEEAIVWTTLDCVQGFFVNYGPEQRGALTVRFQAEVHEPILVGASYAIVGFDGHGTGWDGRKRQAAANIFDVDGRLVASAASLWVEPRPA